MNTSQSFFHFKPGAASLPRLETVVASLPRQLETVVASLPRQVAA
jgi:hypothetical protein